MNRKKPHLRRAEQITVYFTRTERRALTELARAKGFDALAPYLASLARERLSEAAGNAIAKVGADQPLTATERRLIKADTSVVREQTEEVNIFLSSPTGLATQLGETLKRAVALLNKMDRDLTERDETIARLEATVAKLADQMFNTKRKEKKSATGNPAA
jgi:hypothetical protein